MSSEVESTLTSVCDFNSLSFDQRGQSNAKATAKYSASFGSGDIFLAASLNDSYSIEGMIFILVRRRFKAIRTSFSEHVDLSTISEKCLSISSSINSGEINSNLIEENKVRVIPWEAIKAENSIFASTTSSILNQAPYFSTWRLCMPARTFRPNSKASSSVNFDFETIALSIRNWFILPHSASLATSSQSKSLCSCMSFFKSSGTVKVNVAIPSLKSDDLFKPFAG